MKLWILRPIENVERSDPWEPWYDKAFGFVIRAKDEDAARTIAAEYSGNENEEAWTDPTFSSCVQLKARGPEEMILMDFAAA